MMEPNSFTSEPQYQRPDQRNSDIDYIRYPEPLMVAQPTVPVAQPVVPVPVAQPVAPGIDYGYDPNFARRLFAKMGTEYIIILLCSCFYYLWIL